MSVTLNTNTEIRRYSGLIGIYTYYSTYDKNMLFFVANEDKNLNGVSLKQGELGYTNNGWNDAYFVVNERGEFIVISDEASKFQINLNGELEYIDMGITRNLGQVSAFFAGTVPPTNTSIIWYDTNIGVFQQKYWDINTSDWVAFSTSVKPQVMYRQDVAAVSGETVISFRSDLSSVEYEVEILSFLTPSGVNVASGWTIPIGSKTLSGFTIIPPSRYTSGSVVYRASLYV